MKVLSIRLTHTANDYPYGFKLRCKATFSIEFDKKKGFRSIFQTVNPKNDRINAPKKSTYGDFYCIVEKENGHYEEYGFGIRGYEDITKAFAFIAEHYTELGMTNEMHSYMSEHAILIMAGNMRYTQFVDEVAKEEFVKTYFNPAINKLRELNKMPQSDTYQEVAKLVEKINEFKGEKI